MNVLIGLRAIALAGSWDVYANGHQGFKEFIELAISAKLKFLVIGGWAFNRTAEPRMTGDIDF